MAQQADKRISLTSATVALYDQCYPQTLWPRFRTSLRTIASHGLFLTLIHRQV